jgi:hypothetical protein
LPVPAVPTVVLLIAVPLLAWRLYSRFRRLVGRQRFSRVRQWISLGIFVPLIALLAWFVHAHVHVLASLGGGMLAGAVLAQYGLKHTKFEPAPPLFYFTPNTWLGVGLFLLFVGRILFRLVEIYLFAPPGPPNFTDFSHSAVTLAVFGLLAGYRMTYAVGLLRWRTSFNTA